MRHAIEVLGEITLQLSEAQSLITELCGAIDELLLASAMAHYWTGGIERYQKAQDRADAALAKARKPRIREFEQE